MINLTFIFFSVVFVVLYFYTDIMRDECEKDSINEKLCKILSITNGFLAMFVLFCFILYQATN